MCQKALPIFCPPLGEGYSTTEVESEYLEVVATRS